MNNGNLTGLADIVGRSRNKTPESDNEPEATPARPATRKPRRAALPEPATGAKYTDPERVQLKAYVRRTTKIDAEYKWKREGRGNVSDLIEHLMQEYLSSK